MSDRQYNYLTDAEREEARQAWTLIAAEGHALRRERRGAAFDRWSERILWMTIGALLLSLLLLTGWI